MRKIIYIAVAAVAALSSCSSEDIAGNNDISSEAKVFTGTIDNDNLGSRSTLVSNTANWDNTDKVCINGAVYTVAPLSDATKATFTKESGAEPTGTYKAFYTDGANSGNYWDSSSSSFKLPASYSYSVAGKFNMPMYAQSTTTSLSFKNICGVLAITVPANTTSVVVKSENQMNGAFTATAEGVLTFAPTTITTAQQTVTVTYPTSSNTQVVYVPVPAGNYDALVIECNSQSMTVKKTVTVERNKIYSITFSDNSSSATRGLAEATISAGSTKYLAWIQLWSGGPKFATINVGATNPKDYGNYYAWGETTTKTNYSWSTYKYGTESTLTKYTSSDNKTTLESTDDAATANWGSGWRMPTQAEYQQLNGNCTRTWDGTNNCYTFTGNTTGYTNNSIFLPAAGFAGDSSLSEVGSSCHYWSSSLVTSSSSNNFFCAYDLLINSSKIDSASEDNRHWGFPVRPVVSQ